MRLKFSFEADGSRGCFLEIINEKNITPNDLQKISIGDEILSNVVQKHVIISGRAPIFIYMYVALRVFQAGAAQISIRQVQETEPVIVFPIACGDTKNNIADPRIEKHADSVVCEYHCSTITPVEIKDLPALTGTLPVPCDGINKIVVAGKMPIWLAAAIAISAKSKGWGTIEYLMPRFDGIVSVSPHLKMKNPLPELRKNGVVIGIVGDPNSGKSVFAELLEQAGLESGVDIWRYDCDYAAPTPNWYLDMMKNGRNKEGSEWRQSYKRKWIPGAEDELVSELQNLRKYIRVIIADLPGGRHERDLVQRLPPGREILFHEVDFFIIVAKRLGGFDSGDVWKYELEKIGMRSKIVQTFYSEQPEQNICLREDNDRWHILGLDRTHKAEASVKADLWELVKRRLGVFGCPLDIQN